MKDSQRQHHVYASRAWLLIAWMLAALCAVAQAAQIDGARVYLKCIGCHQLDTNAMGPRHCGVVGRKAASVPGFRYSEAMRESGIVWTRETLDDFLRDPAAHVPGTTMIYAGVADDAERRALIDFLARAPAEAERCLK